MPADELVRDVLQRVGYREMTRLAFELCQKHRLEHVIAQLFSQPSMVVAVNRGYHLVGLLEHEWRERIDGLLTVPGTAVRGSKRRDDVEEARECPRCAKRVGHSTILACRLLRWDAGERCKIFSPVGNRNRSARCASATGEAQQRIAPLGLGKRVVKASPNVETRSVDTRRCPWR